MSLYVGVNGSPKKVKKLLVGANGTVKEATSAFTGGVNSRVNQVYSSRLNIDQELTSVNPVKALSSGQITKNDVGKTVYLSNSQCATQEWRIADVNHDGAYGTVDLFPKYVLQNTARAFSSNNNVYKNSSLRTWLNGDFYNGFTNEIKNAMKVQSFPSNGETLSDKVKCPSLNEVGCRDASVAAPYCLEEGTIYPIFGTQQLRPNNLSIYTLTNGTTIYYWTRSRDTVAGNGVWGVNFGGGCNGSYCNGSYYVVACIRF